jgi:hypothetical protein
MARSGKVRRIGGRRAALLLAAGLVGWMAGLDAVPAAVKFVPDAPNELSFPPQDARFVRLTVVAAVAGQPCIDELEVFAEGGKENLALASRGAKATASSCLPGYAIHQIPHLNDGRYGNSQSWIAAGEANEWAQIELAEPARLAKVVFSRDREGQYRDRMPRVVEVRVSEDGRTWTTVCRVESVVPPPPPGPAPYVPPADLPEGATWDDLLRYAFLCERATWLRLPAGDHLSPLVIERPALPGGSPYWGRIARLDPLERTLVLMDEMIERLAAKAVDVAAERIELASLRQRQAALGPAESRDAAAGQSLYLDARAAKRRLMFRDPDLAPLARILFVKRHPYLSSHNYSDVLDSQFRPGGGVCVLEIPRRNGRFEPSDARVTTLFDASAGIARDPVADFDAEKIYFAYRPSVSPIAGEDCYWHVMEIRADGSSLGQLTDGPFHDYYPCPLPDGGLAMISTRCKCRFLCWRPQAFVLFRMEADGSDIRPLSFANLSEWTPTVMRDGRVLWTRSEYLDKGANFGHTLWAIRPDGTHPELIYGNNTINCYMNGREVPGTQEIVCTLVSHGGDHNGPIGLVDVSKGPFNPAAVTSITPDVRPQYDMSWLRHECFRDPAPVSRDYFVVAHTPADRWGLYLIDRYGNRELLYLDPAVGSMSPTPLRPAARPPTLAGRGPAPDTAMGQFTVEDVYQGLSPAVARGKVKYIRVCQEVRSDLEELANGEYRKDHGPAFQDFYATPIHKVTGPFGWPSYVAKASLGLAPVEPDGSASFYAPAGKVLYFEALDEDFNELQRMRSVVQLQPGEQRSCIGCHEERTSPPPVRATLAARRLPSTLELPPWGAEPFSYEKVVQPVWDAKCVRCHDAADKRGFDLTGRLDGERVPASYRTLISGGWVHYFNWSYGQRHHKAEPVSFGTLKSKLWPILEAGHYDVRLTRDEMHRVKCWTDLNCPLWPDYTYRADRCAPAAGAPPKGGD